MQTLGMETTIFCILSIEITFAGRRGTDN